MYPEGFGGEGGGGEDELPEGIIKLAFQIKWKYIHVLVKTCNILLKTCNINVNTCFTN